MPSQTISISPEPSNPLCVSSCFLFRFLFFVCFSFSYLFSMKKKKIIHQRKIQFQLGKLLCPTCDKLKFRCVCPNPMQQVTAPSSPAPSTCTRSAFGGSETSINCNVNNNHSHSNTNNDKNDSQGAAANAFRSLSAQWSSVFGSRNNVHCTNDSSNSLPSNRTRPKLPKGSKDHFILFI